MKRPRAWSIVVGAGLLAASSAVAISTMASAASAGCTVAYTVTGQWPGGFQGALAITNHGDPLTTWTVGFTFPDSAQRVVNGWSGRWSQSGANVTVANESWNGNLGTSATMTSGFIGAFNASNPVPTSFTLNGATCTGPGSGSPTPSISPSRSTSPSPSVSPSRSTSPSASVSPSRSTSPSPSTSTPTSGSAPALHVSGNKLLTAKGQTYRLLGVDRSSGEFACVQGKGMWDSTPVDQASVDAMKTWNIHAVRIPLNEQCWLGLAGSPNGAPYQQAVKDYVNLLVANGINPILDLHWNWGAFTNGPDWHCKEETATCQKPMPDAKYAPQFWTGVANAFKGNNAVVFDLFNEPYPEVASNWDKTLGWQCLRDGGTCTGLPYEAAGMQTLVNAVRATGAGNVLMIGGLEWANDLREWLTYKPTDPMNNIAASWHAYSNNACASVSCWDTQVAPVIAQVPVVLGEFGEEGCGFTYMQTLANWADSHGVSYLAWTWNAWGCTTGAVLIKDYAGTPEPGVGEGYKAQLLSQNPYS
jgi:endoglucanase